MGNGCSSGPGSAQYNFSYFISKYGKDEILNITKDNVRKQEILKKMPQIAQKYRLSIHNSKISSIRQLNIVEASLIHEIQAKIKQLQLADTGEVTRAQQHYGKPAEDLLGRQELRKNCTTLRNKILNAYQTQEKKTKEKIQTDFQTYVSILQKERKEKFVEIERLSQENRQAIRRQGKKKFKKEIQTYRQQISNEIEQGKIVNMVHLNQDYSYLHPREQIQQLKAKAQKLIKKGQSDIIGIDILGVNSKQILPSAVSAGFWKCY